MAEFIEKYINPFTDYGFKKLFGEELNKDLLLDFLNELLSAEQGRITDLTYLKTEYVGYTLSDRKAVFDLYCENEKGELCGIGEASFGLSQSALSRHIKCFKRREGFRTNYHGWPGSAQLYDGLFHRAGLP